MGVVGVLDKYDPPTNLLNRNKLLKATCDVTASRAIANIIKTLMMRDGQRRATCAWKWPAFSFRERRWTVVRKSRQKCFKLSIFIALLKRGLLPSQTATLHGLVNLIDFTFWSLTFAIHIRRFFLSKTLTWMQLSRSLSFLVNSWPH